MLLDDDAAIWRKASRSIKRLTSVPDAQKEELIVAQLEELFKADREWHCSLLLGVLRPSVTERSRKVLIEIFRNSDGRPKPHEIYDSSEDLSYTNEFDLKSHTLDILRRLDISELHREILDFLPKCESNWLPVYIQVAGEQKIQEAFEVLISLPLETLEDSARLILDALNRNCPERACEWATELMQTTSSPHLLYQCSGFLQQQGIDPESIDGFRSNLVTLFSDLRNRCHVVLYDLLRRYKVEEAVPQIISDFPLLSHPDAEYLNMPVWQMFETLAVLENAEGHEALMQLLPESPAHYRKAILEYLGRYRPRIAVRELERYRNDPELDIRELCDGLLLQIQSMDNCQPED